MKYVFRSFIVLGLMAVLLFSQYEHIPSVPLESRFIKLSNQGKELEPWQGPWSCILDMKTGLVWENKTDDETIHDALWTFSWYIENTGVENSGDCYFEPSRCDTQDLIRKMNQEKTCGLTDWRLPNLNEFESIVNHQPKTGQAKIYNDFFSHTKRGDYWSANHGESLKGVYKHLGEGALAMDFIEGKSRAIPYRNAAFVRLVTSSIDVSNLK